MKVLSVRAFGFLTIVPRCVKQVWAPQWNPENTRHRKEWEQTMTATGVNNVFFSCNDPHWVMNFTSPDPWEAGSWCRDCEGDSEESLPDGHLIQRGQMGEVRMHQADSLEEAAILGCGHLWQVCFQKRTEVMSSRLLTPPPPPNPALSTVTEHGSQPWVWVLRGRQRPARGAGPWQLPPRSRVHTVPRNEHHCVCAWVSKF